MPDFSISTEAFLDNPKAYCEQLAGGAPHVVSWRWPEDVRREVCLPPGALLLVEAPHPFRAELRDPSGKTKATEKPFRSGAGNWFALFLPLETPTEAKPLRLRLSVFEPERTQRAETSLLRLPSAKGLRVRSAFPTALAHDRDRHVLCANERGGYARVRVAWGELHSKYDALLAANLHPAIPVDRRILLARVRGWVRRKDYSAELRLECQTRFAVAPDGTDVWRFDVPVGEGLLVPLRAELLMPAGGDAIRLAFVREPAGDAPDRLPDDEPVELILRPDVEDRCHHEVTKAHLGPETVFPDAIEAETDGFRFAPAPERALRLRLPDARFFAAPEWTYSIAYPIERQRGLEAAGDLFSPGYFSAELNGGQTALLLAGVERDLESLSLLPPPPLLRPDPEPQPFEDVLRRAMHAFVVRRDDLRTVIAGYPWFLDWGRDTLICLRGLVAAGHVEASRDILLQFAKFERSGTIPNVIRGDDVANRETSDAPLWLFVAAEELAAETGESSLFAADCGNGRTLKDVLASIAEGYLAGTENGIRVDSESALVFSPSHFTWMDTNYPAGTPRQGYPVEIQALWHRALKLLARIDPDRAEEWNALAGRVRESVETLFPVEAGGTRYLADVLAADSGIPAREAEADDALRPNQLFAVTLGLVESPDLKKSVVAACETLLVPGAIRSLADRPVRRPAPVWKDGQSLNDPLHPYRGRYEGDEDTSRKPAYHNGTAWTWPFPSYAEALVSAYGDVARPFALDLLASANGLLESGCLLHLPEILDGDAPHAQRGCGAQAWGVTELFRVARLLALPE